MKHDPEISEQNDSTAALLVEAAMKSDDIHTKVGCVVIARSGQQIMEANRLTDGVEPHPDRLARPEKYDWLEHAERRAIFHAARRGIPLEGGTMHVDAMPCVECARAIAQSGISRLVHGSTAGFDPIRYKFDKSRTILESAGVHLTERSTGDPKDDA